MTDYISREAAINATKKMLRESDMPFDWQNGVVDCLRILELSHSADVREAKRGEWKRHHKKKDGVYSEWCTCSVCGQTATAGACYFDNETPFCPWCGADMREEQT